MYPFTWDIHCSIQQSASNCCSLFNHCYLAIHLITGLKLSRSLSRLSVYMYTISIQITVWIIFGPCKRGICELEVYHEILVFQNQSLVNLWWTAFQHTSNNLRSSYVTVQVHPIMIQYI